MEQYRRYGRWAKRAAIFLTAYVLFGLIFLGVSPSQALLHPGASLAGYRSALVILAFIGMQGILYFVLIFWFMGRGTYYTIYPNEYEQTFEDVRGQPAAVLATKEVLRLFRGFKEFKKWGGYPPHGILFEGPPGTGKTLMAKAIAGSAGVPILIADGSRFFAMFLGVGNMKIRSLFKRARAMSDKYGGCVIFIDEIDALGSRGSRGGSSDDGMSSPGILGDTRRIIMGNMGGGGMGMINELLVQLDGFVAPRGLWRHVRRVFGLGKPKVPFYNILVIAATNRAIDLDPALVRPGRFDRKIHVGLPDGEGRQDIAQYYLAKVRHEPVDVAKLARMTMHYSPARIKNVINEALIFALQDDRDALRWDDLWQAKLTEEIGLKQPVKYTPREKEMVALHESAHAVASYTLERDEQQIQVITIQKRESALGLVHGQDLEESYLDTQKQMLASIQVFLAGLVGEEIWFGQTTSGPTSDLTVATFKAALYVGVYGMGKSLASVLPAVNPFSESGTIVQAVMRDAERQKEMDAVLEECRARVRTLLQVKRHAVEGVRDALLEREELIGDEIEALMAELGEREPIEIPVGVLTGNGQQGGKPVGIGSGAGEGDGHGTGLSGDGPTGQAPPRPDVP
jgi:cell division protease FtsH